MPYLDLSRDWCKSHNLILNRVKCLNHVVLGAAEVRHSRGSVWSLWLWGRRVCEWEAYDLSSVTTALAVADALFESFWDARRLGNFAA